MSQSCITSINSEQRGFRGALPHMASPDTGSTKARTTGTRGVHFGDAPVDELRGVKFNTNATDGATVTVTALQRSMLAEQFTVNLNTCSPTLPPSKAEQIELVLQAVLTMCEDIAAQGVQPDGKADLGQLLPVGAYHLGVMLPTDQVDVVYVAPLHITLSSMLTILQDKLDSMKSEVEEICPAGTDGLLAAPGLQFKLRGIHIKLLLSQRIEGVPPPQGEMVLGNIAGVFAREVSEKLLASVPEIALFRDLFRFAKNWAKQRGIYGSFFVFMGGTAWAICCARICQMHPQADLAQLAARFFRVLSRWNWQEPLYLLPDGASGENVPATPASDASRSDASIVVLLPAGNAVSATPHLTDTTTKISQRELQRGFRMTQQVELMRAQVEFVYSTARFFQRYRHYLEFDFMASNPAVFASWQAWGRQQMQNLVQLFESTSSKVVTLRPWPEWIDFMDAEWPHSRALFVGLHLERSGEGQNEGGRKSIDLREPLVKFLEAVSSWPEAPKYENQFELLIRHVRLSELKQWMEHRNAGRKVSSGGQKETANDENGVFAALHWKP